MPYGVPQVELEPSRATGFSTSIGWRAGKVNRKQKVLGNCG